MSSRIAANRGSVASAALTGAGVLTWSHLPHFYRVLVRF